MCCFWQWKENPSLPEAQVQSMALGRQAGYELEIKHREAIYRDVVGKQQTVRLLIYFCDILCSICV